jgi:hypothetical protein
MLKQPETTGISEPVTSSRGAKKKESARGARKVPNLGPLPLQKKTEVI